MTYVVSNANITLPPTQYFSTTRRFIIEAPLSRIFSRRVIQAAFNFDFVNIGGETNFSFARHLFARKSAQVYAGEWKRKVN